MEMKTNVAISQPLSIANIFRTTKAVHQCLSPRLSLLLVQLVLTSSLDI
jgi:hypothetical protein